MNTPTEPITLNHEDAEALIARVHQSNLSREDAGVVEWVIRMYFWVAFALQEAKLSIKRLQALVFGPSQQPQEPAVGTTMFQRLKFLIYFLGLYLNRRQAKALLEQIQASNLNDEARDRIIEILRFMLRLPEESLPEPSSPQAPLPARSTPARQVQGPAPTGNT